MGTQQYASTRRMAVVGMLAAAYTAINLLLLPVAFGAVQVRLSEALCLLAVTGPVGIAGVTLGCALTNIIGVFTGANILGLPDVLFGTIATYFAALLSYKLRNVRWRGLAMAACVPPIVINAVVIGGELWYMLSGGTNPALFFLQAAQVGLGQTAACLCLGVPLLALVERNGVLRRYFD